MSTMESKYLLNNEFFSVKCVNLLLLEIKNDDFECETKNFVDSNDFNNGLNIESASLPLLNEYEMSVMFIFMCTSLEPTLFLISENEKHGTLYLKYNH